MKSIAGIELKKYLEEKPEIILQGDFNYLVEGFCSLNQPKSGCITWIKKPNQDSLCNFEGCHNVLVVTPEIVPSPAEHTCYIVTPTSKAVFFDLLHHFWSHNNAIGIAADAVVETEHIGQGVSIGHHCYINPNVDISEGTIIEHNVTILCPAKIGENCIIHSGVVIGTDGFGYYTENGIPVKVEHFGGVIIGDNVEIGANTCIDRGTIDNTYIGNNVKIDNLVHVGHNVTIADNSMVIALSMLGGSSILEKGCYVAPSVAIKNQVTVGEKGFVGMGAVVVKDVEPNTIVVGSPAKFLRTRSEEE